MPEMRRDMPARASDWYGSFVSFKLMAWFVLLFSVVGIRFYLAIAAVDLLVRYIRIQDIFPNTSWWEFGPRNLGLVLVYFLQVSIFQYVSK